MTLFRLIVSVPLVLATHAASAPSPSASSPAPRALLQDASGSDLSTLPALHPDADWLPLATALYALQVIVEVQVGARPVRATLDTGAMRTVIARALAVKIGARPSGASVRAIDAHGSVVEGERAIVPSITIGRHTFKDIDALVVNDAPDGFLLVGADVLAQVDLYLAPDDHMVGVFDAGLAPIPDRAPRVFVANVRRQLVVNASAAATDGRPVQFDLLVDTGATGSSVPAFAGVNGRLPADLRYATTMIALGGEQETRGRFVLDPLVLGHERHEIPRVLATASTMAKGDGLGLLGNDVLFRTHTIISFRRAMLAFVTPPQRPPFRVAAPGGLACGNGAPCVRVAIARRAPNKALRDGVLGDRCLEVVVDDAYAGKTIELAVTAEDAAGASLMNGGALRVNATVPAGGYRACLALWRGFAALGVDESTPLSLRAFRSTGVTWSCDALANECIHYTGTLAQK